MIVGIDEVGRGPWAGPLVIGAVVMGNAQIEGLTDSKKLSKQRREVLAEAIRAEVSSYGLGWVTAGEIDQIGLSASLTLGTIRALEQIAVPYHEIIIDGTVNFLDQTGKGKYVTTLKKADLLIGAVSAASIIAKVARDEYMQEMDRLYPNYGFASHVGYGTAKHREAIDRYGITPLHRLSFAPLKKYKHSTEAVSRQLKDDSQLVTPVVSPKQAGDRAEDEVAKYLLSEGHDIIERNWKTKFCEIDIISRHGQTIYFTEVKYRRNSRTGGGLAAVTSKKLQQMTFAAEYFAVSKKLSGRELRLCVGEVEGSDYKLTQWLKIE